MHNLKGIAWIHFILGILLVAFACWVLGLAWWSGHATAGGNKLQHFHEGMLLLALGVVGGTLLPVGVVHGIAGWKLFKGSIWAGRVLQVLVWGEVLGVMPFVEVVKRATCCSRLYWDSQGTPPGHCKLETKKRRNLTVAANCGAKEKR